MVGGERELRESIADWNQQQIEKELQQRNIIWKFQPPNAPHMSGVWERLVKTVKRALKAVLGEALVSDDVLATTLVEIEGIFNSRPVCKLSDDPRDEDVLTPNHFLMQRKVMNLPSGMFVDADRHSRKHWKLVQVLANHFWQRWLREYLPKLQQRTKWLRKRRNAQVGDLVLMVDTTVPRGSWPLGRITNVYLSRENAVRTVEVKPKGSFYIRPIHRLCLLEESQV